MKNLPTILSLLDLDLYESQGRLIGCCPIHKGDNISAFNINIDEDSDYYGYWFCNTAKCHEEYFGILGLIQGVMDWSLYEVTKFVESLKGDETPLIENDNVVKFFSRQKTNSKQIYTREEVRSKLVIPAEFYLDQGYSKTVLDEFDIGYCNKPETLMYDRVVFPVYSNKGMIGCTGRTTKPLSEYNPSKWINSRGFNKSSHFYGIWRTIEHIKRKNEAILVEGQGDVIRLYQHGIMNVLGLFGSSLSDHQEYILQKTGISDIIIMTDNDETGRKSREKIEDRIRNLFNYRHITVDTDPGNMTEKEILQLKKVLT